MRTFASIFIALLFVSATAGAQNYTDKLQRKEAGKGTVVVHQDDEIAHLVNNGNVTHTAPAPSTTAPVTHHPAETHVPAKDSVVVGTLDPAKIAAGELTAPAVVTTHEARGFRVQLTSRGNSAKDKNVCRQLAQQLKNYFPDVKVYVKFISPHWTCRAGDFATREEATEFLQQVRETNRFQDAMCVKCIVNLPDEINDGTAAQ